MKCCKESVYITRFYCFVDFVYIFVDLLFSYCALRTHVRCERFVNTPLHYILHRRKSPKHTILRFKTVDYAICHLFPLSKKVNKNYSTLHHVGEHVTST